MDEGWYPDPLNPDHQRHWTGEQWSAYITAGDGATVVKDPLQAVPSPPKPNVDALLAAPPPVGAPEQAIAPALSQGHHLAAAPSPTSEDEPVIAGMNEHDPNPFADEVDWTMMAVVDVGDFNGLSGLYPIPTTLRDDVMEEPGDGHDVSTVIANSVSVSSRYDGDWYNDLSVNEISAVVRITDSRLSVACSKYDKGGGWVGGAFAMIVLNTASIIRATVRRQGTMLVGHVRYPWLTHIGVEAKTGWNSDEVVVLYASTPQERLSLRLQLPKSASADRVAQDIARRAARFRLAAHDFNNPDEHQALSNLADAPLLNPGKGEQAKHQFPAAYLVKSATAFSTPEALAAYRRAES